jgi:hypothetical protein
MHRTRVRISIVALIAMVGALLMAFAEPAGAAPVDVSGCKAAVKPAAQITHYPAWPANQSSLRAACVFNAKVGDVDADPYLVSSSFTLHDFANVIWHNGSARTVQVNGAHTADSTINVDNCKGMTAWVNRVVSGTGIPARTTVKSVTGTCNGAAPNGTLSLNRSVTVADNTILTVDNGSGRSFGDFGTTNADATITSTALANFTSADIGCSVSGTDIPAGAVIDSINSATSAEMDMTATGTSVGNTAVITLCGTGEESTTRIDNGATYSSTTTITTAGGNRFAATDIGLRVSGTGITQPCHIISQTPTVATVGNASGAGCVTVTAGTKTIQIGEVSVTSPLNGDQMTHLNVQLDLSPDLVAGSGKCSEDIAEGFSIQGEWANPGSFIGGAFATQPAATKAIGQVIFQTSVIDFGAFIIERRALTSGDPIGVTHYDVVFPNLPTTLALCASATSPGLGLSMGFDASTSSITNLPQGTGQAGTAQLRSTRFSTTGSTTTAYMRSDDGVHTWSGVNFERLCGPLAAGAPDVDFTCGAG